MSSTWWEKVLQFIGFEEIEQDLTPEELEQEELQQASAAGYEGYSRRRGVNWRTDKGTQAATEAERAEKKETGEKGSLVSLPAAGGRFRLIVVHPQRFDEVQYIANHLKERRPVIMNLEQVEQSEAQKLVNFLSGAIFALDGEMERIGTSIILFTPVNVEVSIEDVREELQTAEE